MPGNSTSPSKFQLPPTAKMYIPPEISIPGPSPFPPSKITVLPRSKALLCTKSLHQSCFVQNHYTSRVLYKITTPVVFCTKSLHQSCFVQNHYTSRVLYKITTPVVFCTKSLHQSCFVQNHYTSRVLYKITTPVVFCTKSLHQSCSLHMCLYLHYFFYNY